MSISLVATVGSDFHPFNRLVAGIDQWLASPAGAGSSAVVQHGTSAPSRQGQSHEFLDHDRLLELMRSCDVVLTQGGPMGIIEARRCGVKPIVMPRLHALGEHVDNHQVAFCHQMAASGDIVLVESVDELCAALDRAAGDVESLRVQPASVDADVLASVERFAGLVAALPLRRGWLARRR